MAYHVSSDGGTPYLPSQARLWFVGFVEYADVVGKFERSGIPFRTFLQFQYILRKYNIYNITYFPLLCARQTVHLMVLLSASIKRHETDSGRTNSDLQQEITSRPKLIYQVSYNDNANIYIYICIVLSVSRRSR